MYAWGLFFKIYLIPSRLVYTWGLYFDLSHTLLGSVYPRDIFYFSHTLLGSVYPREIFLSLPYPLG